MRNHLGLYLALAMLVAAMPLLSACYATKGAGEDLQSAGKSLSNSADKNTSYKP